MTIKVKYIYQILQDIVLTMLLVMLMGFHLWEASLHEWFGSFFAVIVLKHLLLNMHWFLGLFKGQYDTFRILKLSVNFVLFFIFVASIMTGLMLSQYLFPNLPIHNASDLVRKLHMTSVHWLPIVIAIHLGVHWKMLARFFATWWHINENSRLAKTLSLLFVLISLYGIGVFLARDMLAYLLVQVDYAFFDFDESWLIFYADYIAVIIFIAYTTRFLTWFFLFRTKDRL